MVVGICQTDIIMGDTKYNLISAEDYIHQCKMKGACLAVFPEMSMTGFGLNPEQIAESENGVTVRTMSEYALRYQIALGFGYVRRETDGFTNRYAIVNSDGRIMCDYAKIHPFSYAGEDKQYKKGSRVYSTRIGNMDISPLICYDLRFPEIFQAVSVKSGLIIVAANWPAQRSSQWKLLLQARALENQSYVIGVNRVGAGNDIYYSGDSMLVDPEGQIMDILSGKAGIMIVDVDKDKVDGYRTDFPVKKDRQPELYARLGITDDTL